MFYHENFCANLWVVLYSCYIPQLIFLCYLIILQENLSCALSYHLAFNFFFWYCLIFTLHNNFVFEDKNILFFTCDDWKVIIWKDEYKKVPIWNGLLGFKVWNPQLFLVASKQYKHLLLRCKAPAEKIVMYLEGTLLSSRTFPPQRPLWWVLILRNVLLLELYRTLKAGLMSPNLTLPRSNIVRASRSHSRR